MCVLAKQASNADIDFFVSVSVYLYIHHLCASSPCILLRNCQYFTPFCHSIDSVSRLLLHFNMFSLLTVHSSTSLFFFHSCSPLSKSPSFFSNCRNFFLKLLAGSYWHGMFVCGASKRALGCASMIVAKYANFSHNLFCL